MNSMTFKKDLIGVQNDLLRFAYKLTSDREIAEKLGLPLGTVKSRIFFTRQKLQQELKDFV